MDSGRSRQYSRDLREYRLNAGLCVKCGVSRPRSNSPQCSGCLEERRRRYQRRKAARITAGLCVDCGKLRPVDGQTKCDPCLEKIRAAWRAHPYGGKAEYHAMHSWLLKCRATSVLGGHCVDCGEEDVRVLEFDHVNGDGCLERKAGTSLRGQGRWRWVVKYPEEATQRFQVLCANCHARKTLRDLRGR